jgi:hypothetical protein
VNSVAHKLNHVDLVVEQIGPSRDFLARWFGMTIEQNSESICLMRDGGGLLLILRKAAPARPPPTPARSSSAFSCRTSRRSSICMTR